MPAQFDRLAQWNFVEDEAKTFRGRAMHACLAATETDVPELRAIFESLSLSYTLKAEEAERRSAEARGSNVVQNQADAEVIKRAPAEVSAAGLQPESTHAQENATPADLADPRGDATDAMPIADELDQ